MQPKNNKDSIKDFNSKTLKNIDLYSKYLTFITKQTINALDPQNYFIFNKDAQQKALETNFKSVADGINNLFFDALASSEMPYISRKNQSFKIGENIACTKGKVIYRTEILELITFNSSVDSFAVPTLIIPSTINKYYVLDLSPENSMIKYMVDSGLNVFCISFNNLEKPTFSFEECLEEIIKAAEFICEKFNTSKINLLGYCLGGTMASLILNKLKNKINSVSFLNSGLDYESKGDFDLFVNDETMKTLKQTSQMYGCIKGKWLQQLFNYLKSKNAIWPYIQNNYLLGNEPIKSDVMYWNDDAVNQSSTMLIYFLENIYIGNKLAKDELIIFGEKIILDDNDIPKFFLGCANDHIINIESIFASYKKLNNATLCITTGGHINGMINPPHLNKGKYWVYNNLTQNPFKHNKSQTNALNDSSDSAQSIIAENLKVHDYGSELTLDWIKSNINESKGSWWIEWSSWIANFSGTEKSAAATQNHNKISTNLMLDTAPGEYIKKQI